MPLENGEINWLSCYQDLKERAKLPLLYLLEVKDL